MDNQQPSASRALDSPDKIRKAVRSRVLFFLVAWAIVLMPFLFWRSTWFGRPLSDEEIGRYLRDEQKPRHIQHALVQIGERMAKRDPSAAQWYPELVRLASHPVEEIRNTDAWIMGQDNSRPEFHDALRKMLQDPAPTVRSNAALSLVRFGDSSGRAELVRALEPAKVTATRAGTVADLAKPGTAIRQGGMVARLESNGTTLELRSAISGRVRSVAVQKHAQVAAGTEIALVDPAAEQVWEALRGLYLIGEADDLPIVREYQRELPEMPDRIRQQASMTERAILERTQQKR